MAASGEGGESAASSSVASSSGPSASAVRACCGLLGNGCDCALIQQSCLGYAAPVRVVQNPNYAAAPSAIPPAPAPPPPPSHPPPTAAFYHPSAMYAAAFQGFPVQPNRGLTPLVAAHCFIAPPLPVPERPPQSLPPTTRVPAKRPPPREPSIEPPPSSLPSDDELLPSSSSSTRVPTARKGAVKKALRITHPVRSHSTSELCLEEQSSRRAAEEEAQDGVFAAAMEEQSSAASSRKHSRGSGPTHHLIDLTFQSDDDDVSLLIPSDRATEGSASVHDSEPHFGDPDDIEVVQLEEEAAAAAAAVAVAPLDVSASPLPSLDSAQQMHGRPMASARLQAAATPAPIARPSHSNHAHGFYCGGAFPLQSALQPCPHATCSCHLRPRAPCSYWASCHAHAATLYCHHHHLPSPQRPSPCPLHSPCPYPCPFTPTARPLQDDAHAAQQLLRPQPFQLAQLQHLTHHQHQPLRHCPPHPSLQTNAAPSPDKPSSSSQLSNFSDHPQQLSSRTLRPGPPASAIPRERSYPTNNPQVHLLSSCRRGGGSGGGVGGMTRGTLPQTPLPEHRQMRNVQPPQPPQPPRQAVLWPQQTVSAHLNAPLFQRNHYQAQRQAMANQREAHNHWFDAQRRQRQPAGVTYAVPNTPAAVQAVQAVQAVSVASVANLLSAAAASVTPAAFPTPELQNAAAMQLAAAAEAASANYQRQLLGHRSASPILLAAPYPYGQAGQLAGQRRGQAGQISIVVSPTGQATAGQAGAGLMTATVPMQVDWMQGLFPVAAQTGGAVVVPGPLAELAGLGGPLTLAQTADPQPVGASLDTIERCSSLAAWKSPVGAVPAGEEERCTVCLSEFQSSESVRTLHCQHNFHSACIDRWLTYNKKCPVCRLDVDGKELPPGPSSLFLPN